MTEACFECSSPATVLHHVLPRSKGGTKTVPLCRVCHSKIHNLDLRLDALREDGKRKAVFAGKRLGGLLTYGYDADEKGYIRQNEKEQDAISIMKFMRASRFTIKAITVYLNEIGTPTKCGKKWSDKTVFNILRRKGLPSSMLLERQAA